MGRGYLNGGKLVNEPFDFSAKNRFSLTDLLSVLQSLVFPEIVPDRQRFNLKEDDYLFLYRQMSLLPREFSIPQYQRNYPDRYVKFLLFGGKGQVTNPSLRIFNKVGDAYGFLQDVAYIADFESGGEFMLSASIYCNSNGVFNDENYEYEKVGFPFLKHLGEVIYQHEQQRVKKHLPDLFRFKINAND